MSRKLNVLVYSGAGTTTESVRHCLYTLRRLLSPHYAVTPVDGQVLIKEPWTSSCALLCMPGGADLGFCRVLNGEGNRRIAQYVRRGGSYIGFCAGGYYGSSKVEFEIDNRELEVVGSRELQFYPGTCRGAAFKGFIYNSEAGAKAAEMLPSVKSPKGESTVESFRTYYNGGGVFVDAEKYQNDGVEILAKYSENLDVDGGEGRAAVVLCHFGDGNAILTGSHPEFAAVNLDRSRGDSSYQKLIDDLEADDNIRINFLKMCLTKLGLRINTESTSIPSLSKLYLTSSEPHHMSKVIKRLDEISKVQESGRKEIAGENDVFVLEAAGVLSAAAEDDEENINGEVLDYNKVKKHIQVYEDGVPHKRETPYFDHNLYYDSLQYAQSQVPYAADRFGTYLLYGEVVTSTNTMLDKNFQFLQRLPSGLVAVGSVQIAGRGRGSNVWVSPIGLLPFSLFMRHPLELGGIAPVVFVQYLVGLAVVEAIRSYGPGYKEMPVRLKWPNDIYAEDPSPESVKHGKSFIKIGGILINSNFADNQYLLVAGCGINTTNAAPTTSLNHIVEKLNVDRAKRDLGPLQPFHQEILLAKIMVTFEGMYDKFCRQGFHPFEQLYYNCWLHSEQIVRLEMEGNTRARVKGITMDEGLLKVDELNEEAKETGRSFTLQTDNNSFDFFSGLLKKKT